MGKNSIELHSVNGNGNANSNTGPDGIEKSPYTTEIEVLTAAERDAQALARLGKKPVLKVMNAVRRPLDLMEDESEMRAASSIADDDDE